MGKVQRYNQFEFDTVGQGMWSSRRCRVQVYCYEDSKLLKLFSDIGRSLYDNDIIAEDTILRWYHKGSHPKGRQVPPLPSV